MEDLLKMGWWDYIKMELEYDNVEWTEEDEEEVKKIKDNATWLFKIFLIGMACGVSILLLLKLMQWWALNHLIGGILWIR